MPSSWDIYYVVFLSALLALGVPALLALISYLVSSRPPVSGSGKPANGMPLVASESELPGLESDGGFPEVEAALLGATDSVRPEVHSQLGSRINARFFLGVNASLLLIALALALIPCAGSLRVDADQTVYLRSLIAIISLAAFAGLGLLYASRKGDLSWVGSFQSGRPDERGSDACTPTASPPAVRPAGETP
jgi:hypothetical protein